MRLKHFYILSLCLVPFMAARAQQNRPILSQTSASGGLTNMDTPPEVTPGGDPSYIKTYVPVVPITDPAAVNISSPASQVKKQAVYLDGSKSPYQSISYDVTNTAGNNHMVQIYDNRPITEQYSFLPYTSGSADVHANAFQEQRDFYASLYPDEEYTSFSGTTNSSSPTERSVRSFLPGKGQVGNNYGYTTKNITNTASQVIIWNVDANGLPVSAGYYAAGELYGTEQTAPDDNSLAITATAPRTRTFTDREGRTILNMVADSSYTSGSTVITYKYTYYVYDSKGNLRCTITPKAFKYYLDNGSLSATVVRDLCFQYRYDAKGRPKASQKPGELGFTSIVYDSKDRPVMRQTPNEAVAPAKWELTFYDALGRVKATSLFTDAQTADTWQTELDNAAINGSVPGNVRYYLATAAGESIYPTDNAISGNQMMSYSWYDDYTITDPGGSHWLTMTNQLQFSETQVIVGAEAMEPTRRTYGMVTGTRVRILPAPGATAAQVGDWRSSVLYYDDKGRPIYTMTTDFNGANILHRHITGTQYDFAGRVLTTKHLMINNASTDGATSHVEVTKNLYDATTGKLVKTTHKVDNGNWRVLNMLTYDELGRPKRNNMGNGGEVQDMSYNIRGQLTGLNKVYAETGVKSGYPRSFGESLKYDFGFERPRYDGKIAGIVWRGAATDMYAYGYDYTQDGSLKSADFNKSTATGWNHSTIDYSVPFLYYDKNGNITDMKQRGVKPAVGPVDMDILHYTYTSGGNRLEDVAETGIANYGAGDFNDPNPNGADFNYDANGNLTQDVNKGINVLSYTHFNKPVEIIQTDGGRIKYSYDAAGNKVQEIVTNQQNVPVKTTDYIGNYIYENNALQYSLTGTGRTVYTGTANSEEFFVKDHLGNVRSVIDITVNDLTQYLASYELASANLENLVFDNIDDLRDLRPDGTGDNSMAARLDGDDPETRIGTSLLMHVMAGDLVSMNVDNFYESYDKNNDEPVNMEEMLSSVVQTLSEGAGGFIGSETHNTRLVTDVFNMPNYGTFHELVNQAADVTRPKAFLNYLLFNERMELVQEMSGAFQVTGEGGWTEIGTTDALEVPENGYLAVYISNGSKIANCNHCSSVWFDEVKVQVKIGQLKEESHYYPFGLPIYGMGSTAAGFKENRRKYQSNEYIKDIGLNWMDFNFRQYDPQIGRFLGVDPLADYEGQDMYSPYAAMGNAPESMVDPEGLQYVNVQKAQAVTDDNVGGWATDLNFALWGRKSNGGNTGYGANQGTGGGGYGGAAAGIIPAEKTKTMDQMLGEAEANPGTTVSNYGVGQQDGILVGIDEYGNEIYYYTGVESLAYYAKGKNPNATVEIAETKEPEFKQSFVGKLEWKLNRAMEKNWIGDLAGPESSWEGKEGFKNKGWPTMMKTWSALGTIFTGGALGFEAYGVFAAHSAGTATFGAYSSLAWSTTSFTVGTYNFLSPNNKYGNKFGPMVDVVDAFRYANPFGIFNLGFRIADYSIKQGGRK
ncbi:MAG: RHS repeat-associated core domain-containing protein [Taibaiella sp.]|jgi:RHS repeat-associated protein